MVQTRSSSASSFLDRRTFLRSAAVGGAAAAVLGAPHVARAQAKLSLGLWDHWVPGANNVLKSVIEDWGKATKVEERIGEEGAAAAAPAPAGRGPAEPEPAKA